LLGIQLVLLANDNGSSLELNLWLAAGTNAYTSGTLQTNWGTQVMQTEQ
jgi:hypothetical protein